MGTIETCRGRNVGVARNWIFLAFCASILIVTSTYALSEEDFISGPQLVDLGDEAEVLVPAACTFAGEDIVEQVMEAIENPVSGDEVGAVFPDSGTWYVVFEFAEEGYVKDDEKDDLDADAMLGTIRETNKQTNELRKDRGWSALSIQGWSRKPYYDDYTHNLQWAIRLSDEAGSVFVNHNTRILGRYGYMIITLVCDVDSVDQRTEDLGNLLQTFRYKSNRTYAEYREGDKVSEYGLAALVVGGGAAIAAKTGLFKWLWKILLVVFVGASGFLKKLFRRNQKDEQVGA